MKSERKKRGGLIQAAEKRIFGLKKN